MKKISSRDYLMGLRVHLLPVVVWLATLVCVIVLFSHRSQRYEVVGMAEARVYNVGLTCRARLISVPVQLFDNVSAGETIAIVNTAPDDERLEAEQAVIEAQMAHLELELNELRDNYKAEVKNRKSEWFAEKRAFTADVVMADVRVHELEAMIESDRPVLEKMQADNKTFTIQTQSLVAADTARYYELQAMKADYNALVKKIEENENLLVMYREELKEAKGRKKQFEMDYVPVVGTTDEDANNVKVKAIEALQREWDELEARRTDLELTAPFDGVVSQIDGRVGEIVFLPDLPILTITEGKPTEIIAYASRVQVRRFRKDMKVDIVTRTAQPRIGRNAKVTYIGPTVEQMPTRLWFDPTIPEWGQPIRITIPPGLDLIPGEVIGIRVI